jgi:chemotaxis protein histidine kinase CheA
LARLSDPEAAFLRLKRTVEGTATVGAQLNEVARFLAGHGYAKSHDPVGRETWAASKPGERPAKLQFYVWLDTPFGDDLVLSTGPSFKPALALGSSIPKDPGVGIYVASILNGLKKDTTAAMQRAEARGPRRQETFTEAKERRAAESKPAAKPSRALAPKPAERPAKPKGPTAEELAALAHAEQETAKRAKWKADEAREEAREEAAEKARVAKSMAAAKSHNEAVERERAAKAAEDSKRAAAQAKAEAEEIAREAKAQGDNKSAAMAKAAAAEAADFLKFLEEAAGE